MSQTPSSSSPRSLLLPTTMRGRSSSSGRYCPSSDSRMRRCSAGDTPPSVGRAQIQKDDEHPGALEVPKELVAEALAFRGTLHQARDVRHDELGPVAQAADPDHTEMRFESREGVVGDFGLRRRDRGDQRRLAGIGEADQGDVRHELELHVQPELLALLGLLGKRRGAAAVREKARVAAPTLAAFGHHEAGTFGIEVADDRRPFGHARRYRQAPAPRDPCPGRRAAWSPSRARHRWPGGRGDPGSRGVTPRSRRQPARRPRHGRRRRRRDHHGPHGPPCATRPPRHLHHQHARAIGPGQRSRA